MSGYLVLTALAVMIILGHTFGKLAEKIKLPEVTGMIVAGIILNLLFRAFGQEAAAHQLIDSLQVVVTIALSFVSYILGTKFFLPKIKENWHTILPVVTLQFVFVVVFTTLGFWIFKDLGTGLLIGAISAATAPAPIIEITKKYKSHGSLTNTLFAVVSLDNIIGISYFYLMLFVVTNMAPGQSVSILLPLGSIFISIAVGAIVGLIIIVIERKILCKFFDEEKFESYLLTAVGTLLLIAAGIPILSNYIGIELSPYIAALVYGFIYTNAVNKETYMYETEVISKFIPPLITSFFVIAGMELDITKLPTLIGLYAILYVLTHTIGKYLGAYLGTRVSKKTSNKVKTFLPTSVLTQGGFEIALAALASSLLGNSDILLIVLTSVLIIEFFAPLLLTKALLKSGEGLEHEIHCIIDPDITEEDL